MCVIQIPPVLSKIEKRFKEPFKDICGGLPNRIVSIAIFLSFVSFSYHGVCFGGLKHSVNDRKGSNGEGKLKFFGRDYYCTRTLLANLHLWVKIHKKLLSALKILFKWVRALKLIERRVKNKPMETYSMVRKEHKIVQWKLLTSFIWFAKAAAIVFLFIRKYKNSRTSLKIKVHTGNPRSPFGFCTHSKIL